MHNHTGLLRPETHELMMKGMYQLLHAIYLCSSQSLCKLPAKGYEYTHSPAHYSPCAEGLHFYFPLVSFGLSFSKFAQQYY